MTAEEILDAIQAHYELPSQTKLAERLCISYPALYQWKKRNTYNKIMILHAFPDLNPEWLEDPTKPMTLPKSPTLSPYDINKVVERLDIIATRLELILERLSKK
ncbi:MAG: hypothetical protein SOW44_07625 [Porphyromonas sp.]|nr:hypothetical protein [Bacteroidales bacterium]MDD7559681.1 hypothetical protein [Bacteroidales bacterium]MDY3101190.1 hypothetical protein [Porphyromonas sp.]